MHKFGQTDLNSLQYSPTHVQWTIPPSILAGTRTTYRARILSLNLFNSFPSIPKPLFLKYFNDQGVERELIIPRGNWNAYSLADYLTLEFKTHPTILGTPTVTYDISVNRFYFSVATFFSDTNAQIELGLTQLGPNQWVPGYGTVNLSGVTEIQVTTSWSAANVPLNGKLATIPNSAYYTEELQFYDTSGDPFLIVNQEISSLEVILTDQNGKLLSDYLDENETPFYPPWTIVILLDEYGVAENQ